MNKKGGNLICMRPDSIVEARFKLTKKQNDIMDMVFASIEDDGKLEYEIDIKKYTKLYNLKDKSDVYGELKKAVKTFEGKGFSIVNKINKNKENRIYFSWFASIEYIDGDGRIIFELGNKLKQLLLEMKKATFYNIQYTLNFSCIYSKRLYYYLKSYENSNKDGTGWRIDDIDTLREKLECPTGYKNFADFNRYVLKPAYEEINGGSDISYEYEPIKTGRKMTHIKFYIKPKKVTIKSTLPKATKAIEETSATLAEEIFEILPEDLHENIQEEKEEDEESMLMEVKLINDVQSIVIEGISEASAKEILAAANNDIELIRRQYQNARMSRTPIPNIVGWLIKAVRNNYPDNIPANNKIETRNSFTNRKQANYNIKDIERKILGLDDNVPNTEEGEEETFCGIDELLGRKRSEEQENNEEETKLTGMERAFKSLMRRK